MTQGDACLSTLLARCLLLLVVVWLLPEGSDCQTVRRAGCKGATKGQTAFTCAISEPPVATSPPAVYEDISFQPGDLIQIRAGGCVALPDTRKLISYLDARDFGKTNYARGLVFLPGITQAFVPIADLVDATLQVPWALTSLHALHPWLAYGFDTHGTSERQVAKRSHAARCSGKPFVNVLWRHPGSGSSTPQKPFDLRIDADDDNFFPRNPVWVGETAAIRASRREHPDPRRHCEVACAGEGGMGPRAWRVHAKCASLFPYIDEGVESPCRASPFKGHVNWGPATYRGTLKYEGWEDPSKPWEGKHDDDLLFFFFPENGAGLTGQNEIERVSGRPFIEVELNRKESGFRSDWWRGLECLAKRGSCGTGLGIGELLKKLEPDAIVIGLLGLDTMHDFKSELHPVFGLAVHDVRRSSDDDVWYMFVQNEATEGEFGKSRHYLDVEGLTFRLAGPKDAIPEITQATKFSLSNRRKAGLNIRAMPGEAIVTLAIPRSDAKERVVIDGELHLRWIRPGHGSTKQIWGLDPIPVGLAVTPFPHRPALLRVSRPN